MSNSTKILIIRFSSIGDIVLTTPVMRHIQEQFDGDVEIHYLTKKAFKTLLENNPRIHQIHTIEKGTWEIDKQLEEIGFDYILDLHNNLRSRMIKRKLKTLSFTLDKLNFEKWLYVNFGINNMPKKHVVARYLDTLKAFGVQNDGRGLEYYFPEDSKALTDLPLDLPKEYIALSIGGAHIGKRMSVAQTVTLLNGLEFPVVLLGGKGDQEDADAIVAQVEKPIVNACGKLNIHESARVVESSKCLIAGDTGLMHIGSAFNVPIVSVWGCTVPEFGMYPYLPHPSSQIIEPEGLSKRPCSKLGNKCKYGEKTRCITHIPSERIIKAVGNILGKP